MSDDLPQIGYMGLGLMGSNMPPGSSTRDTGSRCGTGPPLGWRRPWPRGPSRKLAGGRHGRSDLVQLCLRTRRAVEAVVFGPGRGSGGGRPGKMLVDHSTIGADATRTMAARLRAETGMGWVDAPVSGGRWAPRPAAWS